MRKPCLDCGVLTETGSRCPAHESARNRARHARRPWYGPEFRRLRDRMLAEPNAFCVACGTMEDLTVDHIIPRSLEGGLQVLCRSCNASKGG